MSMISALREVSEAQIDGLLANPESIHEFLEEEVDEIDLDKAWHGLHFLFTGSAWEGEEPLCYLVKGGEEIGEEEIGYDVPRALRPAQVLAWSEALAALTVDELRKRFNPAAMTKAGIYQEIWGRPEEEDDTLGYLLDYYEVLQSFLIQTKAANKGVIIYLI